MLSETVTKTVKLPLQTSNRKNERVREVINEWQRIASGMANLMPSVDEQHWRSQDTTLSRLVAKEFPETPLRSHDRNQAAFKVGESFGSWKSNGHDKERPQFGNGNYARFCHCGIEVAENDSGYGVKVGLEPYDPEWWHISGGLYQTEILEDIAESNLQAGSGELHLEDGQLALHLSISQDVEVLEWSEVTHTVGVDLGENIMYCAVVAAGNDVKQVEMESGTEYRHYRESLKRKRQRFMENDNLRGIKKARNQYEKYTDHITHVASREIVDLATEYDNCGIVIEDLSHYRESADDAIHDWPYAELQTKIIYKATEEGIPVKKVDPAYTSVTCRKCGHESRNNREGSEFSCVRCGYEVHADVNAAANLS